MSPLYLGRIPHNTLSLDNYQFATRFLHAYFEKHAIKDKRQKQGVIKMPKNITCKTIHDAYQGLILLLYTYISRQNLPLKASKNS